MSLEVAIEFSPDSVCKNSHFYEVENALAATRSFPYWTIWQKPDDGKQQVTFIKDTHVERVDMWGQPEEPKGETQTFKLIQFPGGENDGPVSQG